MRIGLDVSPPGTVNEVTGSRTDQAERSSGTITETVPDNAGASSLRSWIRPTALRPQLLVVRGRTEVALPDLAGQKTLSIVHARTAFLTDTRLPTAQTAPIVAAQWKSVEIEFARPFLASPHDECARACRSIAMGQGCSVSRLRQKLSVSVKLMEVVG